MPTANSVTQWLSNDLNKDRSAPGPKRDTLAARIAGASETLPSAVEDYRIDGAAVDEVSSRRRILDHFQDSISTVFESRDVLASGGREDLNDDAGFKI